MSSLSNSSASSLDRRFVRETGVARVFADLVEPILEERGFRLVRVKISGQAGTTVQIMAERPDGQFSIDDCTTISRALSPLLEQYDPMQGEYNLEVSSPGIDRPLVRPSDFEAYAGHEAKIELNEAIDGRKRFRGVIDGAEAGEARLIVRLGEDSETQVIGLPFSMIADAKLVNEAADLRADLRAHGPSIETVYRGLSGGRKGRWLF
jgi:ribosome maturation factor RimP